MVKKKKERLAFHTLQTREKMYAYAQKVMSIALPKKSKGSLLLNMD